MMSLYLFVSTVFSLVGASRVPIAGRQLLSDHDHDSTGVRCERPVADVSLANEPFGIGNLSSGMYYADNMTCVWLIPNRRGGDNQAITIVFTMFHIEKKFDNVEIFNDGLKIATLTGELVVPYAVRIPAARAVQVKFTTDDTFHITTSQTTQSLQIGFQASFMLSDNEECPGGCTDPAFGTCIKGVCNCTEGHLGSDCSIAAPLLQTGHIEMILDLPVGKWAYFMVENQNKNLLVEVTDLGPAASDIFLAASATSFPTFSTEPEYMDWFNWYYDASDIHLVRISQSGPRYYVGVTNHILRSQAIVTAQITVRAAVGKLPCIANCSNHGTCKDNGSCQCDAGYTGDHMGAVVCNYRVKSLTLDDFPYRAGTTVRVGDWIFFKFTLTAGDIKPDSSLLVSLWSDTPRARPILLLAQGFQPSLAWGYLPTFDAFDASFGDEEGFGMLNGMQQNILLQGATLRPGEWQIAVFNIWGFTGIDVESHDRAKIELYFNLFEAGSPCPRAHNDFCSGEDCDFNTGKCKCPVTRLGSACGFQATELVHRQSTAAQNLDIGETQYFVLNVSSHTRTLGHNFVLKLNKGVEQDKATVYLLARKEAIPFSDNYTEWDDHAFADSYYHEDTMTLVLDREELTLGLWYFAVINTQKSLEKVTYTLMGEFRDSVNCPASETSPPLACYGRGTCNADLGRCECNAGSTLDDCSAEGLFPLQLNTPAENTPPIRKDYWAYWGFGVGCENLTLEVRFNEALAPGRIHASAPMLTMRQNRLPLMIEGTYDYTDFYRGIERHLPDQGIRITKCDNYQGISSCVVSPYPSGTNWATGYVKPGVWFIGLYNDYLEADESIQTYSLSVSSSGKCEKCAAGFLGPNCDIMCPGMWPEKGAYANSPFRVGESCSGHGKCALNQSVASCKCDEFYQGYACETSCPGMRIDANGTQHPCSRHGTCVFPKCVCNEGYGGDDCSIHCPGLNTSGKVCSGLGECLVDADGDSVCKCNSGYAGEDCSKMCPNKCYNRGECQMVLDIHHVGSKEYTAECVCKEGYYGESCEKICPGMTDKGPCNSKGFCNVNSTGVPGCICFEGFAGSACEQLRSPAASTSPAGGTSGGVIAVLVIVALIFAIGMAYFGYVVKKQRAALRRYASPMLDDETELPSKIEGGGEAGNSKANAAKANKAQEMQTLNRAPDSESLQDVPLEKVEYL